MGDKIYKRRVIQLISAIIYNFNLKGFAEGKIYRGNIKGVCVPGLNCYSCPGAIASCPLGSLQAAISEIKFKLPLYIAGTLLIFGILLGRAVCAFLCPFGLIQELIYKLPSPKIKKSKWTRRFSLLKYAVLLIFVIVLPLYYIIHMGISVPAFCKYICPAGTLEGGIPLVSTNKSLQNITGRLFNWKILVLMAVIILSVFLYRFFCRFLCPLGAIYSFFNRNAAIGIHVDETKCSKCGRCVQFCKMDTNKINDRECIRCGECRKLCNNHAILFNPEIKKTVREKNMKKALRNIISLTVIIFMIAALFVSCNRAENEEQEYGGQEYEGQEYKELEIGDTAPDFEVELLSGEIIKLSDYKGKAVFVNFWATWCGPCVEELPAIQKLSETFADELAVIEINCSEKKDKVADFISKTDYTFSVGLDEDGTIQEKYPTMGIPYTVIIDADGIITSIHLGASGDMFPVYEKAVKETLGMLKANEIELD